jgi:hypothetical protein
MISIKNFKSFHGYAFGLQHPVVLVGVNFDLSKKQHATSVESILNEMTSIICNNSDLHKNLESIPGKFLSLYSCLISRHKIPVFDYGDIFGIEKNSPETIKYLLIFPYSNINLAKAIIIWIVRAINFIYSNIEKNIQIKDSVSNLLQDIDRKLSQFAI